MDWCDAAWRGGALKRIARSARASKPLPGLLLGGVGLSEVVSDVACSVLLAAARGARRKLVVLMRAMPRSVGAA